VFAWAVPHRRKSCRRTEIRARPNAALKSNAPTWHKILAVNLRRIRVDRHITQKMLARSTGYKLESVKKIERCEHRRLSAAHVQAFADALEVDVTDLLRPHRSKGA
jgi:DNA-binding Xre family transcriptional regulator